MRKLELEQGSAEWHALRNRSIGASDAPIIMGVSPWMTPYQLWRLKVGLDQPKEMNRSMAYGRDNEERARAEFSCLHATEYKPVVGQSEIAEWMIASFDGMSEDGQLLEIKWPGKEDHAKACVSEIPDKYWPQLQHQMLVAGVEFMDYYSCNDNELKTRAEVYVQADSEYQEKLINKLTDFYRCMVNLTPPPLTERDVVQRDDKEWAETVAAYKEAETMATAYEAIKTAKREKLIELAGSMNCKGNGAQLTRVTKKGSVDYSKIPELSGVELDQYRKAPTECWRITLD